MMLPLACSACADQALLTWPPFFYWLLAFLCFSVLLGLPLGIAAYRKGVRLPLSPTRWFLYFIVVTILGTFCTGSVLTALLLFLPVWFFRMLALTLRRSCHACQAGLARAEGARCKQCSKLHHAECWETRGKCSDPHCAETEHLDPAQQRFFDRVYMPVVRAFVVALPLLIPISYVRRHLQRTLFGS